MPTTVPIPMYMPPPCVRSSHWSHNRVRTLLGWSIRLTEWVAAPVKDAAASKSSQLFLNLGPGAASTLDDLNDRHSVEADFMPFFVGNPLLKMVIDAIVGAYGLTYITLGVFMLIVYVLLQLRLV